MEMNPFPFPSQIHFHFPFYASKKWILRWKWKWFAIHFRVSLAPKVLQTIGAESVRKWI